MLHKLNITVIIIVLSYALIITVFSSSEFPTKINHGNFMPYLVAKPITEDGYYMLTVAWNFGQGKGFEYNLGTKTAGVQPLATIIYGSLAFFSMNVGIEKKDFPRVIILFSAIMLLVFSIVLRSTILSLLKGSDVNIIFFLCLLFSLLNFELFITFTNGLETGLYLVMCLISIRIYWNLIDHNNLKIILATGVVFGISTLMRLDFLVVSSVLLLMAVISSKIKIINMLFILILQLLFLLPWLVYTANLTGSVIQSSALAQMSFINTNNFGSRVYQSILELFQILTLNLYIRQKEWGLIIIGLLASSLIVFGFNKSKNLFAGMLFKYLSVFVAFFSLIVIYTLTFHATHFYFRYFSPMIVLLLLIVIPIAYKMLSSYSLPNFLFLKLILLILFFSHAYLYFHSGKVGGPTSLRPGYIKNNFSKSKIIGTFQSGVLGYYFENVVNLDGKINYSALDYCRQNKLDHYIDSVGIDGLMEWEQAFPIGDKSVFQKKWIKDINELDDKRTIFFRRIDMKR